MVKKQSFDFDGLFGGYAALLIGRVASQLFYLATRQVLPHRALPS